MGVEGHEGKRTRRGEGRGGDTKIQRSIRQKRKRIKTRAVLSRSEASRHRWWWWWWDRGGDEREEEEEEARSRFGML